MAYRAARALNFLGADRDLNSEDGDALMDLIDEYHDDPEGIAPPFSPILCWLLLVGKQERSRSITCFHYNGSRRPFTPWATHQAQFLEWLLETTATKQKGQADHIMVCVLEREREREREREKGERKWK